MTKADLLRIIVYSPVGAWQSAVQSCFTTGKRDIRIILNPCRKCLVKPTCKQHKQCTKYQNWFFKGGFCRHEWAISHMLMRLPVGLSQECTKCGKIK